MNLWMLSIVCPLSALLFFDHVQLLKVFHAMDDNEQAVVLGGLCHHGALFTLWFWATYLVSCIALCSSFLLHLGGPVTWIPVSIFVAFHVSLLVWDTAVLRKDKGVVFVCLAANVLFYVALLVYTWYQFPVWDAWFAHACNMVLVTHALLNEFYLWQWGWWQELENEENMCFCNSMTC
jgi:hypothetical protein